MSRHSFLYKSELPHRAVSLYLYLEDKVNVKGECWPSIPTIAKEMKMSICTVRRAIKDLKQVRLLTTEQRYRPNGGNSSLCYKLKVYRQSKPP